MSGRKRTTSVPAVIAPAVAYCSSLTASALALALFTAGLIEEKLGGVISLSGFLPAEADITSIGLKESPVLISHGVKDMMILWKTAQLSYSRGGFDGQLNVDLKTEADLGHTIGPKTDEELQNFLASKIAIAGNE